MQKLWETSEQLRYFLNRSFSLDVYPEQEQTKNKEEPPNPLEEQLIQTLINQKSDDEASGSTEVVNNK